MPEAREPHHRPARSRREFLSRAGSGLGAVALGHLLNGAGWLPQALAKESLNPLAAKQPHHPPKAKSIIWLFMEGGPSHVDLFDPKPALDKLAGHAHAGVLWAPHHRHGHGWQHAHADPAQMESAWRERFVGVGLVSAHRTSTLTIWRSSGPARPTASTTLVR